MRMCLFNDCFYRFETLQGHSVGVGMGFLAAMDSIRHICCRPDYCIAAFSSLLFCKDHWRDQKVILECKEPPSRAIKY